MRTNGYISILTGTDSTEPAFNEYGEPIECKPTWSKNIPAYINTNSDTRLGKYEDGVFRQASYTILVESVENTTFLRVKLVRQGEDLGEFKVISVARSSMYRTKIQV